MRKVWYLLPLVALLLLLVIGWFNTSPAPGILDRAIAAHGGEQQIARSRIGHSKGKGTKAGPHGEMRRFTWEETYQLPDKRKRTIRARSLGETIELVYLFRDNQCWVREGK